MIKQVFIFVAFLSLLSGVNAQKDYYDQLKTQYDSLRKAENYESALLVAKQMNAWALKNETDTSLRYAVSLRYVGAIYINIGKYDLADKTLKLAYELIGKYHFESQYYLDVIYLLAYNNSCIRDFELACSLYIEAITLYEKRKLTNKIDYLYCLQELGIINYTISNFEFAKTLISKALTLSLNQFNENHELIANLYNDLGNIYSEIGEYSEAKNYYLRALNIYNTINGYWEYLASTYQNLGIVYSELKENENTLFYYGKAIEIYESYKELSNLEYLNVLTLMGIYYYEIGQTELAREKLSKVLNLYEMYYSKSKYEKIYAFQALCMLQLDKKEYKNGFNSLNEINEIIKKNNKNSNPADVANYFRLKGRYHCEIGDYEAALENFKKGERIISDFFGSNNIKMIYFLEDIGLGYYALDKIEEAKRCFVKAKVISENNNIEIEPNLLINLGIIYMEENDYNKAEFYYKNAIEIAQMNNDTSICSIAHNNLGYLFQKKGNFALSEYHYLSSINEHEKYSGYHDFEFRRTLNNISKLYSSQLLFEKEKKYALKSFQFNILNLNYNFVSLSRSELEFYWQQEKDFYDNMNSFSVSAVDSVPSSTELSYNANLISKSLLLETSRELDQAVSQSSDEEMKTQFFEMKQLRKLYSKMQSEGSTNKEIMERYKTQADSLDKILVNKLGEYAASKRKFEITWKDVQSNLTTSDAAIEFARYYDDKDSLYKYMALVVRPDYEYPKLVCLGEEEDIRTATQNKDFSALYNEAWKGIDSLLVGVKRVYYSPAGELNNVSFSALCTEEGIELVATNKDKNRGVVIGNNKTTTKACNAVLMDKYELHQLTTTRYLADGTLKKEKPMQPSLALVGGINFDDIPEKIMEADKEQSNEDFAFHANLNKQSASTNGKKRGKRSSSNYGKKMDPLPGTKEEVVNIAGLLNTSNWKVQTKSDKKAGEYEFKKELETKAPGVLHIATHGFAFPDEAKKESKLMDMNQTSTYKVSEDPMVRCGLMLGGSNISWTGNPQKMIEQTGDDGILTAAEVSNLDLSNTKLVVLSACETGLGKIEGSEGTFGLKRGFKLAGVEQMIVSLWSVPDKETMELMTLFYSDLTKTLNPVTSFEKAQKEMRNRYPTDPEKWAGFVLVR